MTKTDDELEAMRLRMLATVEDEWRAARAAGAPWVPSIEDYAPGLAGAHEAMHSAHLAREFVADHVVAHPAVLASPAWFAAAARAAEVLDELYRTFAAEHGAAAEAAAAEAVSAVMADAAGPGAEPVQRAPGGFTFGGARAGSRRVN